MNIIITGDKYSSKYKVAKELSRIMNIRMAKLVMLDNNHGETPDVNIIVTGHQRSFHELEKKFNCVCSYYEYGNVFSVENITNSNQDYITVCSKSVADMYCNYDKTIIFDITDTIINSLKNLYNTIENEHDDIFFKDNIEEFIRHYDTPKEHYLCDEKSIFCQCENYRRTAEQIKGYIESLN